MQHSLVVLAMVLLTGSSAPAQFPFPPSRSLSHDTAIASPEKFLRDPAAGRPARYDGVARYLRYLASASPRARLIEMGTTWEGREQFLLVVTDEARWSRFEEVRSTNMRLADPRRASREEALRLAESAPLIFWAGYSIHGDELSGVDAALHVAYHLCAGNDSATVRLRRELVVCIDPVQNPDGRERFLAQMQQWNGPLPSSDDQSLHHTGTWPYGRTNHYLFDMNRDWFALTQRESRNRVAQLTVWQPQVIVDAHEMGPYDTYLFSPAREPLNPNIGQDVFTWWPVFSRDQARAFDREGWSYYTREWSDDWFPGYGSSYAHYIDAIGILYEAAGVEGSLVKRPDGSVLTYAETVHRHYVSSLANLTTAATNRRALLRNFVAQRREEVTERGVPAVYYLAPGSNPSRLRALAEVLSLQGIEVREAMHEFRANQLEDPWGNAPATRTLPAGSCIVSLDQPYGRLAKALLEYDPRMKTAVLQEERKSLEKEKRSRMYDVTAWSLSLAYGVETYASRESFRGEARVTHPGPEAPGAVLRPDASYGFLLDYGDDRTVDALAQMHARGLKVRSAREPFAIDGKSFGRGALLLRRNENPESLATRLQEIALSSGATVIGTSTALSTSGPDLGGNDMILLRPPRIALVGGPEAGTGSFGALWHLLDRRMGVRISLLTASQLAGADLQKYTVLLLPSGSSQAYARTIGRAGIGKLREWTEAGGTLVGIGEAASFLADTATALSAVRLRHQALKDLDLYSQALMLEQKADTPAIDSLLFWSGKSTPRDTSKSPHPGTGDEKELVLQDERGRLFMPHGALLRIELDNEHWLSFGAGDRLAALVAGGSVLLSRDPVRTPARFAAAERLRVSGLLWPEARARLAGTAYATREAKGRGQLILFAGDPVFRGTFRGTERLLLNVIFLGPGFGTSPGVDW